MKTTTKLYKKCLKSSLTRLGKEMAGKANKELSNDESNYENENINEKGKGKLKESSSRKKRKSKENSLEKKFQSNIFSSIQFSPIEEKQEKKVHATTSFLKPITKIPKLSLNNLNQLINSKNALEPVTMTEPPFTHKVENVNKELSEKAFSSNDDDDEFTLSFVRDDYTNSINKEHKNDKYKPGLTVYEKAKRDAIYHNMKIMRIKNQRLQKEQEEASKTPIVNPKSIALLNNKEHSYIPIYNRAKTIVDKRNANIYINQRMLEDSNRRKDVIATKQHCRMNKSQCDIDAFIEYQFKWKEKIEFTKKIQSILTNDSFIDKSTSNLISKTKLNLSMEEYNNRLYLDKDKRNEHRKEIEAKYAYPFKPTIHPFDAKKFRRRNETLSNISTNAQMSTFNFNRGDSLTINPNYTISNNLVKSSKENYSQMQMTTPILIQDRNQTLNQFKHNRSKYKMNLSWDSKATKQLETTEEANKDIVINEYANAYNDPIEHQYSNNSHNNDNNHVNDNNDINASWQNELQNNSKHSSSSINSKDNLFRKLYKLNISMTSSNGNCINTNIVPSYKQFNMLLEK